MPATEYTQEEESNRAPTQSHEAGRQILINAVEYLLHERLSRNIRKMDEDDCVAILRRVLDSSTLESKEDAAIGILLRGRIDTPDNASSEDSQLQQAQAMTAEIVAGQQSDSATAPHLLDQEGGLISTEEFARQMNIKEDNARRWARVGKALALKSAPGKTGHLRFPVWQIAGGGVLYPGIAEIKAAFGMSDLRAIRFLLLPISDGEESLRPLDLLRSGKEREAVKLAREVVQHGKQTVQR